MGDFEVGLFDVFTGGSPQHEVVPDALGFHHRIGVQGGCRFCHLQSRLGRKRLLEDNPESEGVKLEYISDHLEASVEQDLHDRTRNPDRAPLHRLLSIHPALFTGEFYPYALQPERYATPFLAGFDRGFVLVRDFQDLRAEIQDREDRATVCLDGWAA